MTTLPPCVCGHLETLHVPGGGSCTAGCDCRGYTQPLDGPASPPGGAYLDAVRRAWPDDDAVREHPDLAWSQIHELADRLAERIWPDVHHAFWPGVSSIGVGICRAPGCQRLANHYVHQVAEAPVALDEAPDDEDAVRAVHDDCDPDWCASEGHQVCGYAVLIAALDQARDILAAIRRALDDELANLADDGARPSRAVVRRIEALLAGDHEEADRG